MPYKLKKSGPGWKVCKKSGGKCFSKKPLSRARATSQMAAIYANESFDQAVARILHEYADTTSSSNPMGATTTAPYVAPTTAPISKQLNPSNPADAKNACTGLDPNDENHVEEVIQKFKSHPEWNKVKAQAGGDERKAAKQMIQTNNPAKQVNPTAAQPLNKPLNTGTTAPVSPPSTSP